MEPVVKTFLPLETWTLQKSLGPCFKPDEWRAMALLLVPPPDKLVNVFLRQSKYFDTPELFSPTRRRRIRNRYKHYVKRQLHNNPFILPVRQWFLSQRQQFEARGGASDFSRIPKLHEIEAEINRHFQQLIEEEQLPEELRQIVQGNPDAVSLLWEFAVYGEGGSKPELRMNSAIWKIFGLDPGQLENMPPEDVVLLLVSRIMALVGLADQPPDEPRLQLLAKYLIRTHLPPEEEPTTTPEALSKAVEAGLIHKAIVIRDAESGEVAGMDIEDTNTRLNDLSEAEGREAIIEALAHKGITYDHLTPKEWAEVFEKYDLICKGYEFSSKTGVSISSFYGAAAHAKEQKWSRIKKKISERPK